MELIKESSNYRNKWATKQSAYFLLLCLFAFNLSTHTFAFWPGDSWWLRSLYWLFYLLLDMAFIFGIFQLLLSSSLKKPQHSLFACAVLVSWLPFGLAISMADLAIGRSHTFAIDNLQNTGFITPLLSKIMNTILPRHLSFGALLYIVHFYVHIGIKQEASNSEKHPTLGKAYPQFDIKQIPFLRKLPKNARKNPTLIQAQEHYINIFTEQGSHMILYKFGQAMNEMPEEFGFQIHRSYWVSTDNIKGWFSTANGINVKLHHGGQAPVSRRFENDIKSRFTEVKI
jgi:DNA-binding LytR/AlgR family response regulator